MHMLVTGNSTGKQAQSKPGNQFQNGYRSSRPIGNPGDGRRRFSNLKPLYLFGHNQVKSAGPG